MTFRLVLGVVLLLSSTWIMLVNAHIFVQRHILRREMPSLIPMLGGVGGMISLLVLPGAGFHYYCWVPLLLDWGSLPGLLYAYVKIRRRRNAPTAGDPNSESHS
jgi:hypothetical protein